MDEQNKIVAKIQELKEKIVGKLKDCKFGKYLTSANIRNFVIAFLVGIFIFYLFNNTFISSNTNKSIKDIYAAAILSVNKDNGQKDTKLAIFDKSGNVKELQEKALEQAKDVQILYVSDDIIKFVAEKINGELHLYEFKIKNNEYKLESSKQIFDKLPSKKSDITVFNTDKESLIVWIDNDKNVKYAIFDAKNNTFSEPKSIKIQAYRTKISQIKKVEPASDTYYPTISYLVDGILYYSIYTGKEWQTYSFNKKVIKNYGGVVDYKNKYIKIAWKDLNNQIILFTITIDDHKTEIIQADEIYFAKNGNIFIKKDGKLINNKTGKEFINNIKDKSIVFVSSEFVVVKDASQSILYKKGKDRIKQIKQENKITNNIKEYAKTNLPSCSDKEVNQCAKKCSENKKTCDSYIKAPNSMFFPPICECVAINK